MPSFNQDNFPFVLGLNEERTEIHLYNTVTWHGQLLIKLQHTRPGDSIRQIHLSCIHEQDMNPFSSGLNSLSTNKRSFIKNTLQSNAQLKKHTEVINI